MVWYDVLWYGVVLCDVMLCDVVYGVVYFKFYLFLKVLMNFFKTWC